MVEHFFIGCDRRWMFDLIPKPMLGVNAPLSRRVDLRSKEVSWADSGAFQLVKKHAGYPFSHEEYRARLEQLGPSFYTQMDWPCEPSVREKTGLTVAQHQVRSIASAAECATWKLGESLFVPTIQGWTVDEYLACAENLEAEGLWRPYMAIGSVCRRGSTAGVERVLWALREFKPGTRYHGFGVKSVDKLLSHLWSADSFAWNFHGRMDVRARHGIGHNTRANLTPYLERYVVRARGWEGRGVHRQVQRSFRGGGVVGPAE